MKEPVVRVSFTCRHGDLNAHTILRWHYEQYGSTLSNAAEAWCPGGEVKQFDRTELEILIAGTLSGNHPRTVRVEAPVKATQIVDALFATVADPVPG